MIVRFNYSKLIGLMAEKGITRKQLALEIGRTANFLTVKLQGGKGFKQEDIIAIARILNIADADLHLYFFSV